MNKLLHLFKLGWAYKIARPTKLNYPPYQFTIEPTNVCNLRCPFCPQSDPEHAHRRAFDQLSMDNFKLFLKHLRDAHPGNSNLNFTLDGEPFINPQFVDFVELAAAEGYFCIFASNGTLLDRKAADRLAAAGPFRASIDFAPDKDTFETIRGRKGDYDNVLANLRYLIELAKTNKNVHLDIHDITSYTGADPALSMQRLRALFPADLPSRVSIEPRIFHNFCGHLMMPQKERRYRLCPYPWVQMAIAHNGDCVGCCRDTVGRSVLGNVFKQSVMDIWNGAPYQQFRQNLLDGRPDLNPACKDCDMPWSAGEPRWKLGYVVRSLLGR